MTDRARGPLLAGAGVGVGLFGAALWLAFGGTARAEWPRLAQVEGVPPSCEPSDAVQVSCGDGQCLIVVDNELRDHVLRYRLRDGVPSAPVSLALPGEISDLEAAAVLPDGRVLLLGSHSRNTRCRPRGNRRRLMVGVIGDHAIEGDIVDHDAAIRCASVVVGRPSGALAGVCERLDRAEARADEVHAEWPDPKGAAEVAARDACGEAQPFNIEGAVVVDGRVWVGLRAPLDSEERAILLRMASPEQMSADAATLLDLGGLGVRAITRHGDHVWGIAGGVSDVDEGYRLFRFPTTSLQADASVVPIWLPIALPRSAEGLVVTGDQILVVIDGAEGDEGDCYEPARYALLPVDLESGAVVPGPGSEGL